MNMSASNDEFGQKNIKCSNHKENALEQVDKDPLVRVCQIVAKTIVSLCCERKTIVGMKR